MRRLLPDTVALEEFNSALHSIGSNKLALRSHPVRFGDSKSSAVRSLVFPLMWVDSAALEGLKNQSGEFPKQLAPGMAQFQKHDCFSGKRSGRKGG